jgi:hypothetical protein
VNATAAVAAAARTKAATTETKNTCFVVGPFGEPGSRERAWSDCLCELLPFAIGDDFTIERTIDDPRSGNVTDRIQNLLGTADMVIADLSEGNANAFYEVGFRHGRGLPFVLVCRRGDEIPFNLSTYSVTLIDATYDERERKYRVGELAKAISDLRAQVDDARKNPPIRTFIGEGAYRVRVFSWATTYSPDIAVDWLNAQDDGSRRLIKEMSTSDAQSRVRLAEYLSMEVAAGKLWVGDVFYFVHASTRELALGYAAYQFPTGPLVIPLSGTERKDGVAEITFDQPERQVSVNELQVTLPRYQFTVTFRRNGAGNLAGTMFHPTTGTVVGQAVLTPKWGFRPDD